MKLQMWIDMEKRTAQESKLPFAVMSYRHKSDAQPSVEFCPMQFLLTLRCRLTKLGNVEHHLSQRTVIYKEIN